MSSCAALSVCTSSLDRNDEWKRCCADAMGFEWVDCFDENDDGGGEGTRKKEKGFNINDSWGETDDVLYLTNLLDDDDFEDDDSFADQNGTGEGSRRRPSHKYDVWIENAFRIQADLNRMSQWIESKKQKYIGLDMKDEEAALIQSTVTSFAATTASELETLRNMIRSSSHGKSSIMNQNLCNHRAGIVQILLAQLQEHVTKPFSILQKQRVRMAVQLWQNPLQCKLYEPTKRRPSDDEDFQDSGRGAQPKEQRFLPMGPYQQFNNSNDGEDFISKYAINRILHTPSAPPAFLSEVLKGQPVKKAYGLSSPPITSPIQPSRTEEKSGFPLRDQDSSGYSQSMPSKREEDAAELVRKNAELYKQQLEEELRTESAQLTTTLIASNDLDSVQQMETRMVEITTLIGQFSDLVQDQQEQVLQVHESAKETKDNLDKGQENLIDATERTKKSKHYTAWLILALSAILMFFQILRN